MEIWILGLGAAIGGLVQGIAGFAFAMVAVSIWVWGINPQLAVVMGVFGGWTGQVIAALRVRRRWDAEILWMFVFGSAIGIPIGARLLPLLDANHFKLVLGSMLVVGCSAMLAASSLPRIKQGGRIADAAVGIVSGVMGPLSGFTGLAPALWCTLRDYSKDEHRTVLQNFNLVVLSATLAADIWSGRVRAENLPQMAVVAGALLPPTLLGAKIYVGLSGGAFRKAVLCILVFAGAMMLASALRAR